MISVRDQSSFLGQAKPPKGYRLSYSVGTTFSLDLKCLLQLALNSRRIDSTPQETNELEAFAALQEFQAKAIVFCQNCQIKESGFLLEETRGSKGILRLLAALDATVVAVPAPSFKSAFHPKVWLFRYDGDTGKAPPVFTLCVQSRNLTASKDWDITVNLNGSLSQTKSTKNQALIEFLGQLQSHAQRSQKQKLIQRAIQDLSQVHFDSIPDVSEHWEFLFQWPKHQDWAFLDPTRYRELIAVSPFLGKTVATLKGLISVPKFTLITGPKDIATIERVEGLAQRTYVMAGTNEGAWDTTDSRPDQLGLHAKIYLGLSKDSDEVDVFVGSANLTDAAFRDKNCEAMVHLRCHLRHFRSFELEFIYKNRQKEILHPWLQSYEALVSAQGKTDDKMDPSEELLEMLRCRISQGTFHLRFLKRNQQAVLRFTSDKPIHLAEGVQAQFRLAGSVSISPLEPALAGVQQVFVAPSDERTEFLIIRLTHGTQELRFVTIASSDLNRSARSRTALNHMVKDSDAFFQLLGLMLGATIPTGYAGGDPPKGREKPRPKSHKPISRFPLGGKAFLEPLLLSGLLDREREEEIENAIESFLVGRHPASQKKPVAQFAKLWIRYRKASDALRRRG